MARNKRGTRRRTTGKRSTYRRFPWLKLALTLLVVVSGYIAWLDFRVYHQFEGKRWSLPARVYARPLELYAGEHISADNFAAELKGLGYRFTSSVKRPGEAARNGSRFNLISRPFRFWDGDEPSHDLQVAFDVDGIIQVRDSSGANLPLVRLDPMEIGSIHTARQEDRILLKLVDVPEKLTNSLIAVEDRTFYRHHGVSLRAVGRALYADIRAGGMVQGGSTLTQQLVKNFFLSNERSIGRKVNEALMSLLLELRYSKDEILETYLNEVYLAQDGQRAIHGFGLGSQFFFQRPPSELSDAQIALLVGMVKGPSYYDPRRYPDRALERRNLVLRIMREAGILSDAEEQTARREPLGLVTAGRGTSTTFPAFVDLVRRQLRRDYQESDLTSEGLKIFTTLDPQVQWALQTGIGTRLDALGVGGDAMQAAGLVTNVSNGEVLALEGGRAAGFAGFNRALDAKRPIGSLVKPAVYLTALEHPQEFTLATLIQDEAYRVEQRGAPPWEPQNYDKQFHGDVMLYQALAESYNVATARLGMAVGIDHVIQTLRRLGVSEPLKPYPSLVLGTAELSPLEVTTFYQTFASGGYLTPLRSIRAVMNADGDLLQRYPLKVTRVIDPGPAMLITRAMQSVVAQGTAHALTRYFSPEMGLAGKTGTTDDMRDSWFAGFDGERLGVMWMGRDDNQPMGLSGAAGALQIWRELFQRIGAAPVLTVQPESIEWHPIDLESGGLADTHCANTVQLPFIAGSQLPDTAPCAGGGDSSNWFQRLFR